MAQLAERLRLDLADALARDVERGAHFLQRPRTAVAYAEPQPDDPLLALRELRVEPLERGAGGFEFVDATKGGVIPQQFMPAVEKGVRLAMADGAIAGYPVVDVRVVITDGKSHSVDSKEIAFVTAARKAFVAAVREARPIVLEPVVELEITAADGQVGDITGDLSARRGQVNGTAALGNGQLAVRAQAPLAELSGYQTRLNTLTGGQARYTMSFSHYDAVPPAVQGKLVAQHQVRDEE